MDADGDPVRIGVADAMDVADLGGYTGDFAGVQAGFGAGGRQAAAAAAVMLFQFGASQHGDDAPYGVVVDGGFLARSPNEADQ